MKQKIQCILWYTKFKLLVSVQCSVCQTYPGQRIPIPTHKSIYQWFNQFCEIGNVNRDLYVDQNHQMRISTTLVYLVLGVPKKSVAYQRQKL